MVFGEYTGSEDTDEKIVLRRLSNEIWQSFYPDIFFINQEHDVNQWNTFQKVNYWSKRFLDGYRIQKVSSFYECGYTCDLKKDWSSEARAIKFCSYQKQSGIYFLDFVHSLLDADPSLMVKMKGLECIDLRKQFFSSKILYVFNTEVDQTLLDGIRTYLHELELVYFFHCHITNECSFHRFQENLHFESCQIDSIRSFQNCHSPLIFSHSSIKKIVPTEVNSTRIRMNFCHFSHEFFKLFFFCVSFPQLKDFVIQEDETYSFENDFRYLSLSAPKLEDIKIQGKVRDLDFLTEFRYLQNFSISSLQDDFGQYFPYCTDKKKNEIYLKRNQKNIEIYKMLFAEDDDRFVVDFMESKRILQLCDFLSTLSYRQEDLKFYEKVPISKFLTRDSVDSAILEKYSTMEDVFPSYYYDCFYDTLCLSYLEKNEFYFFFQKFLCYYRSNAFYLPVKNVHSKQIVFPKHYLYALNGIPILFFKEHMGKPFRDLEQVKKMVQTHPCQKVDLLELGRKEFFENFFSSSVSHDLTIENLLLWGDTYQISFDGKEFLPFGPYGRKIYEAFQQDQRMDDRFDQVKEKLEQYFRKLLQVIENHYEEFTLEEKKYLFFILKGNNGRDETDILLKKYSIQNEQELWNSIQLKTDGLFQKYLDYGRGFSRLMYSLGKEREPFIKASWIKHIQEEYGSSYQKKRILK